MSDYKNWKTDQEARRSIQTAIYEEIKADPFKPYFDISTEFGVSVTAVKSLLAEYCKDFKKENPKRKGFKGEPVSVAHVGVGRSRIEKKHVKDVNHKSVINDKECEIIKEYENTMLVLFEGESERILVTKESYREIRKSNNHDYNGSLGGRLFADY